MKKKDIQTAIFLLALLLLFSQVNYKQAITSLSYVDVTLSPNIVKEKITLIPTDFIFNISGNKASAMVGEDVVLKVTVKNAKLYSYKGILKLKYKTAAPFGTSEYTESKVVDILSGENNYIVTIPTAHFTDNLDVTPILDIYYIPTGTERIGVPISVLRDAGDVAWSECGSDSYQSGTAAGNGGRNVSELGLGYQYTGTVDYSSKCSGNSPSFYPTAAFVNYVPLGTAQEQTFSVMINPAPLYLTDRDCVASGCPTNYDCQTSTKTCVRNDVKSLSCVQIGCPVTADKQYECTSAGICAEKVFIFKDCTSGLQCPSGTTCDAASKTCINTIIKDQVVQCSQNSDCLIPCQGVTATCSSSKCSYSGACEQATVQCLKASDCPAAPCAGIISSCENTKCTYKGSCDPVYLAIDCAAEGGACPDGYTCDKTSAPAVCKRDIYIFEDCTAKDYIKASQNNNPSNALCGLQERKIDSVVVGQVNAYCPDGGYSCKDALTNTCEKVKYSCPTDYTCNQNTALCEKSITLDCNKLGCPQGYNCFSDASGNGVCKTEITKEMDCRDLGCAKDYTCSQSGLGYSCAKAGYALPATIPTWAYYAGGGLVLILIGSRFVGKKMRNRW